MTTRIFLSHSAADRDIVQQVRSRIAAVGIDAYLFEHDPQPGAIVADKIQHELIRADAVVVIITPRSSVSSYVHQEIGFAVGSKKPVIPLVEKGTSETCLAMLKGIEYVELDPTDRDSALETITATTTRMHNQKQTMDALKRGREQVLLAVALVAAVVLIALLLRESYA